jgi:glycyl-tRNA synthetase beta chain
LRWVRQLLSIICTFDGEVVPFEIEGIVSGNTTRGHRFLSTKMIEVKRFEDYAAKLHKAHVIVDATARAETIRAEAKNLAFAQGLDMIEDEALLKEVAGLVEWPVVLMGEFDKNFLIVPPEVIVTTIKNNQKCFCLRDGKTSKLANKYLLVSNMVASDGGKTIVAGNNKVIAARLSDAKFFWDQDRKTKLEDLLPKLDTITFHAKLGSQGERVKRIEALAGEIAQLIGADVEKTKLASRLAKIDLVTGMVAEFPELQGLMGHYYALDQGHDKEVAEAIRDHYKPQGPSDTLPVSKIGQVVAVADKLDTLVGFWAIDEKPTGSKDPYALRRAALGIVRILLSQGLRVTIGSISYGQFTRLDEQQHLELIRKQHGMTDDLVDFFMDRMKVFLKETGARHDLIDAVVSRAEVKPTKFEFVEASYSAKLASDDLVMIVRRVEALSKFLETDDGKNLLSGVKRASNILKIEEKKDGVSFSGAPNDKILVKGEEKALFTAVNQAEALARKAVAAEDFESAMKAIAKLRGPVDAFFEHVIVNDPDNNYRENRLKLLNRIRAATLAVADFSKIEG